MRWADFFSVNIGWDRGLAAPIAVYTRSC